MGTVVEHFKEASEDGEINVGRSVAATTLRSCMMHESLNSLIAQLFPLSDSNSISSRG